MAIQTRKNLYRGINPHLNSLLQTPGNEVDGPSLWPGFHNSFIGHIADELNIENRYPQKRWDFRLITKI